MPAVLTPALPSGLGTGHTLAQCRISVETPRCRLAATPMPISIEPPMSHVHPQLDVWAQRLAQPSDQVHVALGVQARLALDGADPLPHCHDRLVDRDLA